MEKVPAEKESLSGCVIVNYRSPWEMMERCLGSILVDNGDIPCRVVLVDNASGDGVIEKVRAGFPQVIIVEMPANAGFAAAVNRGLAELVEPWVLMLNTDAVLEPGSLKIMQAALSRAGDRCAGVAPKMMSSAHKGIIDAVGTVFPPDGASFNRGIGQCDMGQYDDEEEVCGVCFGAALLRRELFEADMVGPLYEDYFLYFEDSDWCMRAHSQGYHFQTAPESVVQHMHSGVTRHESLYFKYKLIELNTLKVVLRTVESRGRAARIVASRCARLLARTFIRRRFVRENLATLAALAAALPQLLRERKAIARRRTVSDEGLWLMAAGEDAYFDTVGYRPDRCFDSLIDTYARLLRSGRGPDAGKLLAILHRLRQEGLSGAGPSLTESDRKAFASQPPCVRDLLARAESSGSKD